MKKILILSDSHAHYDIQKLLDMEEANFVIHAGDSQLSHDNPIFKEIDLYARGNCDFYDFNDDEYASLDNLGNIWVTHGHLYDVKYSLDPLYYHALENNINLVVYGHTHISQIEYFPSEDLLIINPGSTTFPRDSFSSGSYIILEYSDDHYLVSLKNAQKYKTIKYFEYERK